MSSSKRRKERKKEQRRQKQQELLKHFEGDFYQEKKIGDKWFVKLFNGNTGNWQVAIYSEDSFKRYKEFQSNKEHLNVLIDKDD